MPVHDTTIDTLTAVQPVPAAPVVFHESRSEPEIIIPTTFFLFTFGVSVLFMYFRFRTRRLVQEERMRAMDLHIPVPPEPQRARGNPFVMPLLLIGSGLALLVLWANLVGLGDDDSVVALAFGMIALLAGLGWLLAIRMNRESRERQDRLAEMESQAYVAALERAGRPPEPPAPPAPPAF
jgi:hypothetical protein